jgi:hypothetical protein
MLGRSERLLQVNRNGKNEGLSRQGAKDAKVNVQQRRFFLCLCAGKLSPAARFALKFT